MVWFCSFHSFHSVSELNLELLNSTYFRPSIPIPCLHWLVRKEMKKSQLLTLAIFLLSWFRWIIIFAVHWRVFFLFSLCLLSVWYNEWREEKKTGEERSVSYDSNTGHKTWLNSAVTFSSNILTCVEWSLTLSIVDCR